MHNYFKSLIIFTFLTAIISLFVLNGDHACADNIRSSPLAGGWYPDDSQKLKIMLETYLAKAHPPEINQPITALISPHAGYVYSGQAAAYGFKLVQGKQYNRVIVIGPSHYARFHGIAVSGYDYYETPLGKVPVEKSVGHILSQHPLFQIQTAAEAREHSLEMQIPYLQVVLKDFSLVPLMVGNLAETEYTLVADHIRRFVTKETLVVVSSDFTHYGARFGYTPFRKQVKKNLRALDLGAVKPILAKDCSGFTSYVQQTGITICGSQPIALLINLLPKKTTGELLTYYTSGDLMNDYSSAVSYCSIVFFESNE